MSTIIDRVASESVNVMAVQTVVRAPTQGPTGPPPLQEIAEEPEPTSQEVNVFNQMDTPVRDWYLEPLLQSGPSQTVGTQLVEAQVHQGEGRPVTPTIRSPTSEDSWPNTPQNTPCETNSGKHAHPNPKKISWYITREISSGVEGPQFRGRWDPHGPVWYIGTPHDGTLTCLPH